MPLPLPPPPAIAAPFEQPPVISDLAQFSIDVPGQERVTFRLAQDKRIDIHELDKLIEKFRNCSYRDLIPTAESMRQFPLDSLIRDPASLIDPSNSDAAMDRIVCLADIAPNLASRYIATLDSSAVQDCFARLQVNAELLHSHFPNSARNIVDALWKYQYSPNYATSWYSMIDNDLRRDTKGAHLADVNNYDWNLMADRLERAVPDISDSTQSAKIKSYSQALRRAAQFDIEFPFRYKPELLVKLMEERANPCIDQRPLAAVAMTRADSTGAFYYFHRTLEELTKHYRVELYELALDEDLERVMCAATKFDTPEFTAADLMVIAGHGARKVVVFGPRPGKSNTPSSEQAKTADAALAADDARKFEVSDLIKLMKSHLPQTLKPGGKVMFMSCSTGQGGPDSLNIVNAASAIFPQASVVYGPTIKAEVTETYLSFEKSGQLTDVQFGRSIWQPFSTYAAVPGAWDALRILAQDAVEKCKLIWMKPSP